MPSKSLLECSWVSFGSSWEALWVILGCIWALLDALGELLDTLGSWTAFGGSGEALGTLLGALGLLSGSFWAPFGAERALLDAQRRSKIDFTLFLFWGWILAVFETLKTSILPRKIDVFKELTFSS